MKKRFIGLNRYLYTFKLTEYGAYKSLRDKLSAKGTITEVFINNGYAFEYNQFITIY